MYTLLWSSCPVNTPYVVFCRCFVQLIITFIPGVELVYETFYFFTCKNKEFQLLAPLTILWQNS
jgi:hypothetical protein